MAARRPSTYVISLTPFDASGALDLDGFRRHLRRLGDAGIGVYVGGGGSGEGYALTRDETAQLLAVAVDELGGRVPVRAMGVEPRTAAEMIDLARRAQAAGVDALQVYSLDMGHGRRPRPDELEAYFAEVLAGTEMPAVLSTHQSVGYFVPVESFVRLVDRYPNVVGINCTNPDLGYLVRLVDALVDRVEIHVGGAMQGFTALSLGADGFLTSEGNLAPRLVQSVVDRWAAGDLAGSAAAFAQVLRLYYGLAELGGVSGTKAALGLLGLPGGVPRPPRLPVPDEWRARLAALLDHLDIRAVEGLTTEGTSPS